MSNTRNIRQLATCRGLVAALCAGALAGSPRLAAADDAAAVIQVAQITRDTPVDFAKEIAPLLKKHCLACHNATTTEGGLNLESPDKILKGGDSGPAAIAEKGAESLILGRASGQTEPLMPPKDNKVAATPLSSEELGLLKLWIDQGATGAAGGGATVEWQPLPPGVNPIYAVALTPDGQYAACGRANQIFVYHAPTGRFVCRLTDPELVRTGVYQRPGVADLDLVQSLAFSPDGDTLASGGFRTVKLWQRPRNVRAWTTEGIAPTAAPAVAASGDGKWLATGSADGQITLLERATGKPVRSLAGHSAAVTAVTFSADSGRLFSSSSDKTVRIWQVADGTAVARIDAPAAVNAIALVGDGSLIATGGADPIVHLFKLPSGPDRQLADLPSTTLLATSSDRKLLAAAAADGAIRIVEAGSGKVLHTLSAQGAVNCLAFQPDAPRLAAGGADGRVRVWDAATGQQAAALEVGAAVTAVALDRSGDIVAFGTVEGTLASARLAAPAARSLTAADAAPFNPAAAARSASSPDGRLLATAGLVDDKPAVVLRDLPAGTVARTLLGHEQAITCLAFAPDGARLVTGSADGTARLWNIADGKQLASFAGHAAAVTAVAFHPAGQQVISGAANHSLKLWNAADGAEIKNFAGHTGAVAGVAIASSGTLAISGAADQTIRVWDVASGAQQRFIAAGGAVASLALSRDDARLAVLTADKAARLYRLNDGQEVAALAEPVERMALAADGGRLVTIGTGGQVNVWDAATAARLESIPVDAPATLVDFAAGEVIIGTAQAIQAATPRVARALARAGSSISGVAITADGAVVLASSLDGTLRSVQLADGVQRFAVSTGAAVHGLALAPDGKLAATAGDDKAVRLWNTENGSPHTPAPLAGFAAAVRRVSFSADGQHVVGGSAGGEVLAFSVAGGHPEQAFVEHRGAVLALAPVGENAATIVSAAADNTVRVWPLLAVRHLAGHQQPITALTTVPGAPTQILSGSLDGSARLWNTADGQLLRQLDHGGPVSAVAIRPDAARFATAGLNNVARLWNAADGKPLADMKGDFRAQLAVAATERTIAGRKSDVAVFTAAVAAAEKTSASEAEGVKKSTEAVAAAEKAVAEKAQLAQKAADEKTVAEKSAADTAAVAKTADEAKAAADKALADLETAAKLVAEMAAQAKTAADAAPANKFLADAKAAGEKAVAEQTAQVDAAKGTKAAADKAATDAQAAAKTAADALAAKTKATSDAAAAHQQSITAKAAADQALVAAQAAAQRATDAIPVAKEVLAAGEGALKQSEADLVAAQQTATASEQPIRAIAFSPDGATLATAGDDRLVHTWSAETGAAFETFTGHGGPVRALVFDGANRVVSLADDKSAAAWELQPPWVWQRTIGGPDSAAFADRVTALDFSPDGKLLATGGGEPSRSGELKIWNVADGSLAREIGDAHSDTVFGLDFSADGRYLASCGADKFVKVFDAATGKLAKAFEGHTHHVLSVSWQSQGRMLASGGADNVIKVWNFETGEQQRTIGGFAKEVTSVAFIGTTTNTLSCAGDKLVHLHKTDDGKRVRDYGGGADFMYSAAVTPDGKLLVAGGQDSTLRAWNGEDAKALFAIAPPPPEPSGTAQAP